MRFKRTAAAVPVLMAMLSLAACGGSDPATPTPAAAPSGASAPVPASAPAVAQTQAFTAFRSTGAGLTGVPAALTFEPSSTTGTLSVASANFATLTADAANDGMMTLGGTPNFGLTLGVIPSQTPVLFPGIIQACEAVAGQGTPNPAIGNMPTKSTMVAVAGVPITTVSVLVNTFPTYYEDCLRDGMPTPQTTHSSMTIDAGGNMSIFDARTGATTITSARDAAGEVTAGGHNGDWLVPFLYITPDGQRHIAVLQHGTLAAGNPRGDYVGIWLDQ